MSKEVPDDAQKLARLKQVLAHLRRQPAYSRLEQTLAAPPAQSRLDWILGWLEPEANRRREERVERRFKKSKLPARKTLDAFDFDFQPNLSRDQVMDLATLAFVKTGHNVLLAGNSGTGKSHLALSLALLACMADLDVRYTTCSDMLLTLNASLADDSLPKALKRYTLPAVLLIDEVGLEQVERQAAARAGLMQKVVLPRYERRRSTLITSNIDWDMWGDYFNDHLGAAALIDRLLHRSHVIVIEGPSYRNNEHEREVAQAAAERQKSKPRPRPKPKPA
jgi:DNA replication protein DnaC